VTGLDRDEEHRRRELRAAALAAVLGLLVAAVAVGLLLLGEFA
jgi:hypothetical protein